MDYTMTKTRYLSLTVMLFTVVTLWAQDDFNPDSPPEPGIPPTKLILKAEPAAGGSVSGGGKFVPGTSVTARASSNTGFKFTEWTDGNGNVVSSSYAYSFKKGGKDETLTAHFVYEPGNPAEPNPGESLVYYRLDLKAGNGGSVSGGGRYQGGKSVYINATCNENFDFVGWTDEKGETVSTNRYLYYVKKACNETLTANFAYNPDSPKEPSDPVLQHKITIICTEGGTARSSAYVVLDGKTAQLSASPNDGYIFTGWYVNGELYNEQRSFTYTMNGSDVEFEARFEFNPQDPAEPSKPSDKQYALYLMSEITYPGTIIDCPLYLTSLDMLRDMTFQMTFPEEALPDWNTLELGDKASGYKVAVTETGEPDVYQLSLTGGTVPAGNTKLLNVKLNVPETVAPGSSFQVKLNQVSVTEDAGNTVTASTRNGRVYVYKLGDTNGDGIVNITDKLNMVSYVVNGDPGDGSFIKEVSDVNGDGDYSVTDSVGILEIVLTEE